MFYCLPLVYNLNVEHAASLVYVKFNRKTSYKQAGGMFYVQKPFTLLYYISTKGRSAYIPQ